MKRILILLAFVFVTLPVFSGDDITIFRRYQCTSRYTCLCQYTQIYMCPFSWQYKAQQNSFTGEGCNEFEAAKYIDQNLQCHYNYYIGESKTTCLLTAI